MAAAAFCKYAMKSCLRFLGMRASGTEMLMAPKMIPSARNTGTATQFSPRVNSCASSL